MTAGPGSGRISDALTKAEADLVAVWRPADGEAPKARATTMNLVVLGGTEVSEQWLATFDELGVTHPARTLVFSVDPKLPPWELDTAVRAVCRKDPGGEVICSERIDLRLGVATMKRASSVTSALLVPELATVVLVLPNAPPFLVEAILPLADRCILDSRFTSLALLERIAVHSRAHLTDLGFILAFRWRELLARFFDDPADLPRLEQLLRVEIEHAASADGSIPQDVRLIVGWLASRLGWTLGDRERATTARGEVVLDVRAIASPPGALGSLLGIVLRGRFQGADFCLHVSHVEGNTDLIWSRHCGEETPLHKYQLMPRDNLWLVTRAIEAIESDRSLREAIRAAASFHA